MVCAPSTGPRSMINTGRVEFGFLIIWLLFGICAAIVAGNRGENGCLWFTLGLLLGPIGFALAFTTGAKCPACATRISKSARVCPRCHVDLTPVSQHQTGSSLLCPHCDTPLEPGMGRCPGCHNSFTCPACKTRLEPGVAECPGCHGEIAWRAQAPAQAPATKKCPYGAETILSEAKKCKHCGEFLEPPSASSSAASSS
jgi:hypothetical protein